MGRITDDDRHQFEEYFAARRDVVRRTAYMLCGDWHWADDLTQEAFTRVAGAWHRVRDRAALDAFTHTCLMRVYFSDLRKVWRRRENSVPSPPDGPATTDDAEAIVRRVTFAKAVARLPPRQRAVLVCRYYSGLDVATTAEVLRCSEGNVKSQTSRALSRLREVLVGLGIELSPPLQEPVVDGNSPLIGIATTEAKL